MGSGRGTVDSKRSAMRSRSGPPATLGSTARAQLRFIVWCTDCWCTDCRHQVEHDPAEMAERYGAETTVPDWVAKLVCSQCGSRNVSFVVSGTKHDPLSG